jgi:alpha-L-fucosidase
VTAKERNRLMRPTPTPRQLEYQDWEFGVFLHFGIRTFYEGHRDWDGKPMDPSGFNPTEFDCDQWVRTAKEAGAAYMVLTAKHHDGFANWPSERSDFTVAQTPWKDGKGDVIREFTDACRRGGVHPGIYYSPAEWHRPDFKDEKAYDEHFIGQISEILSGYGQIDILWFDGCGSEEHQYDWPRICSEIRKLQPEMLIFNMGDPDFRWIGNESGLAPTPCWNTVSAVDFSVQTDRKDDLGGGEATWLPAECDCRLREINWFYSDTDVDTVKSVEELMGLYYYSVGRGTNLLVNIPPDRRGLLPDPDTARIIEFGREIRRRFSNRVARTEDFRREGNSWTCKPEKPFLIDHAVLMEDLTKGESVKRFAVLIEPHPYGKEIVVHEGRNIGHKAICRFPLVTAASVRVEVTEADGEVVMRSVEVFDTTGS